MSVRGSVITALKIVAGLDWVEKYNAQNMYSTEKAFKDKMSAIIIYGSLGGQGEPTEAYLAYGNGFIGPVLWTAEDLSSADVVKKDLEAAMEEFGGYLSDYEVTHMGDAKSFLLTRIIDDRQLVIHPLGNKVESYYVDSEIRPYDIWHKGSIEKNDLSRYENLGEALEELDQKYTS